MIADKKAKFNQIIEPAKLESILPVALIGQIIDKNITKNDISIGNTIVNYKGQNPPKDSGKHHYVFSLFRQHKGKTPIQHI